ncbi:MAG: lysine--tRNA ligase [Spirochaetales bacterium]|nr:lysine--tRNA ligase [Spirochaetales bacterium]
MYKIHLTMSKKLTHWADITADKIVREKGEKDEYVCASGITPSGTIHIGNFREIISVELVVRALRDRGLTPKFIYSWDEYDVFRKVPSNMPKQEELATYLRKPITLVPDPFDKEESYARANEKELENLLPQVGVYPEYIYQAGEYRASKYAEGIRTALKKQDDIRRLLDEHRTTPLAPEWKPISIFCNNCLKDTTRVTDWDGEWNVSYECDSCGHTETVDLRETGAVKLPWRIDWPMRWEVEGVDFEPAGKDHHSEGGSFDTAKNVVREIFGGDAPVTFQYDFIRIKGRGGKISSSGGEVISLADVLEVYQPEIVRYLFAGTRPNTEFAISFDLDVLKIYEDYDKCERTYFTPAESEKAKRKKEKESRIYELSQVDSVPEKMPYQIQIRHLCNLLQINSGDFDKVIAFLGDVEADQIERLKVRMKCAWNWVTNFAPEDFRFALKTGDDSPVKVGEAQKKALGLLYQLSVDKIDSTDEKEFGTLVYDIAREVGIESAELFPAVYTALIGKEKGPRLISFLFTIGKEKVCEILKAYV